MFLLVVRHLERLELICVVGEGVGTVELAKGAASAVGRREGSDIFYRAAYAHRFYFGPGARRGWRWAFERRLEDLA